MNIWQEWERTQIAKLEAARPKKPEREKESQVRLITEGELEKLVRLRGVTVQNGTNDRSFVRRFQDATLETTLTEREAWIIECLYYKYREQIGVNPLKPTGYTARVTGVRRFSPD